MQDPLLRYEILDNIIYKNNVITDLVSIQVFLKGTVHESMFEKFPTFRNY
jgi:hypothetical protein